MKVEVCKHHQRGYCKFRKECQKYHENETCDVKGCSLKDVENAITRSVNILDKVSFANMEMDVPMRMLSKWNKDNDWSYQIY